MSTLIHKNINLESHNKKEYFKKFYDKVCNSKSEDIINEINCVYYKENFITAKVRIDSLKFVQWFNDNIQTKVDVYSDIQELYKNYCLYFNEDITYEKWLLKFKLYLFHIEIFEVGEKNFIQGQFLFNKKDKV